MEIINEAEPGGTGRGGEVKKEKKKNASAHAASLSGSRTNVNGTDVHAHGHETVMAQRPFPRALDLMCMLANGLAGTLPRPVRMNHDEGCEGASRSRYDIERVAPAHRDPAATGCRSVTECLLMTQGPECS